LAVLGRFFLLEIDKFKKSPKFAQNKKEKAVTAK
jgi:hypothetical protein